MTMLPSIGDLLLSEQAITNMKPICRRGDYLSCMLRFVFVQHALLFSFTDAQRLMIQSWFSIVTASSVKSFYVPIVARSLLNTHAICIEYRGNHGLFCNHKWIYDKQMYGPKKVSGKCRCYAQPQSHLVE